MQKVQEGTESQSMFHQGSRLLDSVQGALGLGSRCNVGESFRNQKGTVQNGSRPDLGLSWGVVDMQGWRKTMEDKFVANGNLEIDGWHDTVILGVFDGHGGSQVAEICADELPNAIMRGRSSTGNLDVSTSFLEVDRRIGQKGLDGQGCTAIVCLIDKQNFLVANVGDSRAVLSHSGNACALSTDHKPDLPTETKRIQEAGGCVTNVQGCFRVNGSLAVSRAMGDFHYKRNSNLSEHAQLVSCVPEIETRIRCLDDEFMIIACDGVWDALSNERAVELVHENLPQIKAGSLQPTDVVCNILDTCLAPESAQAGQPDTTGSTDNMTMILLCFTDPPEGYPIMPTNCWLPSAPVVSGSSACINRVQAAPLRPEPRMANASVAIPSQRPASALTPAPALAPTPIPAPAPAPVATHAFEAPLFELGEAVEVYSDSEQRWVKGIVLSLLPDGGVIVQYGGRGKNIPRTHCNSSNIRKVELYLNVRQCSTAPTSCQGQILQENQTGFVKGAGNCDWTCSACDKENTDRPDNRCWYCGKEQQTQETTSRNDVQASTHHNGRENWVEGQEIQVRRTSGNWTQGKVIIVDHEQQQLILGIEGTQKTLPFVTCTSENIRLAKRNKRLCPLLCPTDAIEISNESEE